MKLIGFRISKKIKTVFMRRFLLLAGSVAVLLVCGTWIRSCIHQELPRETQNPTKTASYYINDIPVYEDLLPKDAAGRVAQKRDIKYVVIHETGNTAAGADAESHNRFIHENAMTEEHSWHYTVDDHQIYQHLPDDEPAYHAGDHMTPDGGNLNGIGVELCVASDNDYEKTLQNGAALAAELLSKYNLAPETALKRHYDFSGKQCPEILITSGRWDEFKQMVINQYQEIRNQPR